MTDCLELNEDSYERNYEQSQYNIESGSYNVVELELARCQIDVDLVCPISQIVLV